MDVMGPIGWIVLGGLAGWIASKFVGTDKGQGVIGNIIAGIIGGVLGGWLFGMLGGTGVTGFNIWSFFVAVVGAVIVLLIWKAITGRKAE
ncbi:MAG TPA: GlsB/YeaQ/YmgE family stress response membrane protein [Candidatus Saccharimonadales bacterium]